MLSSFCSIVRQQTLACKNIASTLTKRYKLLLVQVIRLLGIVADISLRRWHSKVHAAILLSLWVLIVFDTRRRRRCSRCDRCHDNTWVLRILWDAEVVVLWCDWWRVEPVTDHSMMLDLLWRLRMAVDIDSRLVADPHACLDRWRQWCQSPRSFSLDERLCFC